MERCKVRFNCLAQEHNSVSPARVQTLTTSSRVRRANQANVPPTSQRMLWLKTVQTMMNNLLQHRPASIHFTYFFFVIDVFFKIAVLSTQSWALFSGLMSLKNSPQTVSLNLKTHWVFTSSFMTLKWRWPGYENT